MTASGERRWLVLGAGGQLGLALQDRLREAGEDFVAHDHASLDVTDDRALAAALDGAGGADLRVVNAAAWTDVDGCESDPGRADAVNARAPESLARLCLERGARLLHVSTDYVFDGTRDRALTEADPVRPLSVYGRSKLAGERAVLDGSGDFLVVRTAWVFGRGRNFLAAVCARAGRLLEEGAGARLPIVEDQVGSPTWAGHLAGGLLALVERGGRGLYHLANQGRATRIELARLALDLAGYGDVEIEPMKTADLALPADRPLRTVLDCGRARALGVELPPWQEAVRAYMTETRAAEQGAPSP